MDHAEEHLELPGLVRDRIAEGRVKAQRTRQRRAAEARITEVDPVARVVLDLPSAHLDRDFDYAVPEAFADDVRPGVRVKVRFAGSEADGFVLARSATSDHQGTLTPLRRLVSPEPVLTPAIAELAGEVATRYAGTRADVLRLAVPPRHATTEREHSTPEPPLPPSVGSGTPVGWTVYPHADAFLGHLRSGGRPRAVWQAAAAEDWPRRVVEAAAATRAAGRGVLICVPDGKDVDRVDAALSALLGPDHHVVLRADAGPAARYRAFLRLRRGACRIAVGTRAAAFAPVAELGLVVLWDDGDDLLAEPRAPYPHTREVLVHRAEREGAAALLGGFARTVETTYLLRAGWARPLEAPRELRRERVRVDVIGGEDDLRRDLYARTARIPGQVHRGVREALTDGPVLVQTPRSGYVTSLACERCRTPARCGACRGPLRLGGPADPPACRWCGTEVPDWACEACGDRGLRAPVVGESRTAEELGRALPGVPVRTSAGEKVLAAVDARPALVVATPGAEPVAAEGYAAVVLLDTWLLLGRVDLRAEEEALRRWLNAAALVRPGGRVLGVGDPAEPALQALVRWDPAGFAEREAAERSSAHLPPASRLATITGGLGAIDDAHTLLAAPQEAEVLGPVPVSPERDDTDHRLVLRVPWARGPELSAALVELQRLRSARKLTPVRIQVDPPTL